MATFSTAEIRYGAVVWKTGKPHPYLGGDTFASRKMSLLELGQVAFDPSAYTVEPLGVTWVRDVLDLPAEQHRIAERIYNLRPNSTLDPDQIKSHPELAYYARFINSTQTPQDEQRIRQMLNDQLHRVNNEQQPNIFGYQLRRWGSRVVDFLNSYTTILPTVPNGQELKPSIRR